MTAQKAAQATHATAIKTVKKTVVSVVKSLLVYFALACGLLTEFASSYMLNTYHWTVSQPMSSVLYSALCISLFFLYGRIYSLRILILSIIAGIYGMLLLITLHGTAYTFLNGFVWKNTINFELIYRLTEVFIFVGTVADARIYSWLRNTSICSRIRVRLFGDKDTFTGAI